MGSSAAESFAAFLSCSLFAVDWCWECAQGVLSSGDAECSLGLVGFLNSGGIGTLLLFSGLGILDGSLGLGVSVLLACTNGGVLLCLSCGDGGFGVCECSCVGSLGGVSLRFSCGSCGQESVVEGECLRGSGNGGLGQGLESSEVSQVEVGGGLGCLLCGLSISLDLLQVSLNGDIVVKWSKSISKRGKECLSSGEVGSDLAQVTSYFGDISCGSC